ncbi:MAG: hypothetical protein HYU25_17975 [Candidatus Rokubacteria bacterium]|nr:hypothetical protein [Candidatus Rokubacteria bacterium]
MKAILDRTFGAWLALSREDEILALLDLVRVALERRGYVCAFAARKIPPAANEPARAEP